MIVMNPNDLHDQAGMERAFRSYFRDIEESCPGTLNNMLNARLLSCDYVNRSLTLTADAQPWMANPGGILHGGITSAYLDLVMGLICRYFSGGRMTPTLNVDVNFLRSMSLQDSLCIRAELIKPGKSVCYAAGSIWCKKQPDRLCATASGTYFVS